MTTNEPFLKVIEALLDDNQPFPARYLHHFSDISPADLKVLTNTWQRVSLNRKFTLLEDLEDLAETDQLTSFDDFARPLLTDAAPHVRASAIRLLWETEDTHLVPIFREMLKTDSDEEVRGAAANILGLFVYMGELEKIPEELNHEIEDDLLKATATDKDSRVRQRALESLGYSSREEVIPLIESAYQHKDLLWVVSALFAMGRSSDERWKKPILSQLISPELEIRSEAIHAAGELELGAARSILLDLLEDEEDLDLRHELIWALARIGGEGVRAKLEELFDVEEDDEIADFIEEALETLSFTEDMGGLSLMDVNPDIDFVEEEPDDEENE